MKKWFEKFVTAWDVLRGRLHVAAIATEEQVVISKERLQQLEQGNAELLFARGYVASTEKVGYAAGLDSTLKK